MAASLRPGVALFIRWLLNGSGVRPFHQTRAFCKVPPEGLSSASEIEASKADKKSDDEEVRTSVKQSKESVAGEQLATQHDGHITYRGADHEVLQDAKNNEVSTEKPADGVQGTEEPVMSEKEQKRRKREATQKKLHNLLTSLATTDPIPVVPLVKISRPVSRQERQAKAKEAIDDIESQIEPEIVSATKEVAKSLGGDVAATESELLSTLRLHSTDAPPPDKTASLSELFVGMKMEKSETHGQREMPAQHRRYDPQVDFRQQSRRPSHWRTRSTMPSRPISRTINRVDLFGSPPLEIFNVECSEEKDATRGEAESSVPASSVLPLWESVHQTELERSVSHPPENALVEMIQWTNQGKLWTFPIDNEIGLDSEKSIGFHEHIFLECHLEGWCPPRGPIRHFMELVCTGLSKNPYLTVERKKAHIMWYRNYFAEKADLLKEIGAIEVQQNA